jgi:hypothetical protein
MRISPLSKQAIDEVIGNLSEINRKEAEIFNISPEELRKKFVKMIGAPFTGAFYEDGGICQVLFALEAIGHYQWRTHLLAARDVAKIGFAITHFFAKISDRLVSENGGKGYIEIISAYRDGKTHEWFKTMGFTFSKTDGIENKYVKGGD